MQMSRSEPIRGRVGVGLHRIRVGMKNASLKCVPPTSGAAFQFKLGSTSRQADLAL